MNQGNFKITHSHDAEDTKNLKDIRIDLLNRQLNIEQLQKSFGVPTEKDKPAANKRKLTIDDEEDEDLFMEEEEDVQKTSKLSTKRKGPLQTSTPSTKRKKIIPSTPLSQNFSPYQNSNISFSPSILANSTNNSENNQTCSQESGYASQGSPAKESPTKGSPTKSMYSNESGYSSLAPTLCSVPSTSKSILGTRISNLPGGEFLNY